MELLKLLFHHDLSITKPTASDSTDLLAMFTKPDPTYSYFRLSCTKSSDVAHFGLNQFSKINDLLESLKKKSIIPNAFSLKEKGLWFGEEKTADPVPKNYASLSTSIQDSIESGKIVCFSIPDEKGIDLGILSKTNVYESLFYILKPFIGSETRLFSMNGKRISNNALFYFELLPHGRLPHGVEEVTESINY